MGLTDMSDEILRERSIEPALATDRAFRAIKDARGDGGPSVEARALCRSLRTLAWHSMSCVCADCLYMDENLYLVSRVRFNRIDGDAYGVPGGEYDRAMREIITETDEDGFLIVRVG